MRKIALAALTLLGCSTAPRERAVAKVSPVFAIAPETSDRPIRIERRDHAFALEISSPGLGAIAGVRQPGSVRYDDAAPGLDVLLVEDERGFEELRVLHDERANVAMRWHVARAPSLAALDLRDRGIDVIATDGRVVMRMQPMFSIDAKGVRRDLAAHLAADSTGWDITTDPLPREVAYPVTIDPLWTLAAAPMSTVRVDASAVSLADGRVLVLGGQTDTTGAPLSSAEIFDPATSTWSAAASMSTTRVSAYAARLTGGKVLVAGGGGGGPEIYDPLANSWKPTAPLPGVPLGGLVALVDGRALALGGGAVMSQTRVYDPTGDAWSLATGGISRPDGIAVRLASGKVLLAGGNGGPATLTSAEIFDPATNAITPTGAMTTGRHGAAAGLLPSGKVLVTAGGSTTAEIYDPTSGTWSSTAPLPAPRVHPAAISLSDGALLLAGGDGAATALSTVELFDPASSTWLSAGPMVSPRWHLTGAPLPGARALVVGGSSPPPTLAAYSTAEIFSRLSLGTKCSTSTLCASGFCVDGVCCDKACTGSCEACDSGTCSVVTGAPHGTRTCDGFTCNAGACRTTCASDEECVSADYCDAAACKTRKAEGETCTRGPECKTGECVKGTCGVSCVDDTKCGGETYCDGTRCTKRKSNGAACTREFECLSAFCIDGYCCGENRSCSPYICGASSCTTGCTDTDCAPGNVCAAGKCVPGTGATCSKDGLSSIGKDGVVTSCGAYRCRTDGICNPTCNASTECAPGFVCNSATKSCEGSAQPEDSGGCSYGARANHSWIGIMLAALAVIRCRARSRSS